MEILLVNIVIGYSISRIVTDELTDIFDTDFVIFRDYFCYRQLFFKKLICNFEVVCKYEVVCNKNSL